MGRSFIVSSRRITNGLGPRIVWSGALAERVRQTLRELYDRAESIRLPHAWVAREMTAREARDILAELLLPPRSDGRPFGNAPIIAHAVEALVMLSDRRSVEALLADKKVTMELSARLTALGYGRAAILDLLCDGYDALVRAYRRRVRGR